MGFRTDLALEAAEPHTGSPGIEQRESTKGSLSISTVKITDEAAVKLIGKPIGTYVTVTVPEFAGAEEVTETEIGEISKIISSMLPKEGLVLVVGLGNNDVTPDAIGPRTARQILATRHISDELAIENGFPGMRPAAAIAPGVLGQTGMETAEIIKAIACDIKPAAVIAIDALAARSASRLGNTIQIADSGISPGSGVMNSRRELSQSTLGVPVVSIGIPTVVDAATLAEDLLTDTGEGNPEDKLKSRGGMFERRGASMMITPREIDVLIGHACKTLSLCINKALQPDMTLEEIEYLVS